MANTKKTYETPTVSEVPEEKLFTRSEVESIVSAAVKKAISDYDNEHRTDTVVYNKEEYVTLLYIGAIADGTVVSLGKLGQINKAGSTRDIPKKEFLQGMTIAVEKMLENRSLIVVNGLTKDELERFGLDYKEGELLTQEADYKLLNYSDSEITAIFRKLCRTCVRDQRVVVFLLAVIDPCVRECTVDPSHIPFHIKAESAVLEAYRLCSNARRLADRQNVEKFVLYCAIESFEKLLCLCRRTSVRCGKH